MKPSFPSKLPNIGLSIFTEMSMMASQFDAINLSQGFPEFDAPKYLKTAINSFINEGKNQYCPSAGLPELLSQIGQMVCRRYQTQIASEQKVDSQNNITVTSGATEALMVAINTIVRQGDEVIVFDPAYDSYEPAVELAGGHCRHISLNVLDYKIDWQLVKQTITNKTRAIIINSPHNPTGTLLAKSDLLSLQKLVHEHDLYVISDEVYEHMTFDGLPHQSVLSYPELFKRAFVISSFGKTFHCTGWKLGYCIAPTDLTFEFRKIHQYVTFCSFTPAQYAIASMLKFHPNHIDDLALFYQQKRDMLIQALEGSRFKVLPCNGTYFLLLDYTGVSELNDREFCHWLIREVGVATIPLSPFYQSGYSSSNKIVRLCFAKNSDTLLKAAKILCQL